MSARLRRATPPAAMVIAIASLGLLGACGGDSAEALDDGVLAVSMSDFAFDDLPDTVPVGTRIVASNESATELHEFVAVRLADGDERPVDEIVQGDLGAVFAAGPPAAVVLVAPGGDEQIVAVGDGTLSEPGRYIVLCMIPTGVDPDAYFAAAATSDGPPEIDGGPPHVVHGMHAELTVVP